MIVSGHVDVFPLQRREMRKQLLVKDTAAFLQRADGAFYIDHIPECDGSDNREKLASFARLQFQDYTNQSGFILVLRGCLKSPGRSRLTVRGPGFAPAVWKLEWET
jgi:hypothetical protein